MLLIMHVMVILKYRCRNIKWSISYLWSNASTTQDISNLTANGYYLSVTDSNGCVSTDSIFVNEALELQLNTVVSLGSNICDANITTIPSGGTPPYLFSWQVSNTQTAFNVSVAPTDTNHPYYNLGSPLAYEIDSIQGPELILIRGNTYYFNMNNVSQFTPFYISSDDYGGNNFIGEVTNGVINSRAINNQTLTFTPNGLHSDTLYYHCGTFSGMGYRLVLIDDYNDASINVCNGIYTLTVTDLNNCQISETFNLTNDIYGCTDSLAFNYNSAANIDDGSCIAVVYGCTDPGAVNYFQVLMWTMVHVVIFQAVPIQLLQTTILMLVLMMVVVLLM